MLKKALTNLDILAALVAVAWAVAALYATELATLCDPRVAFTFALAAAGRGVLSLKGAQ